MDVINAKKRIIFLKNKIYTCNNDYYVNNNSNISDQKYDKMMKELIFLENKYKELISADSPTQKIFGKINKKFNKFNHTFPMLSLANAFNFNDLLYFDQQIKKNTGLKEISYLCELKIDGISISLIYENYNLKIAATRGNGKIGENVTENVKKIKSIPVKIKEKNLIVRGEIYLPISNFNKINNEKKINQENLFSNPRNLAAGTLKQLDSLIVEKRNLNIFVYYYINSIQHGINTQNKLLKQLKKLKFRINNHFYLCKNIYYVWNYIQKYQIKRYHLNYQIDGIVVKVNNLLLYNQLGYTTKYPKWAIAYKFSSDLVMTKLIDIIALVGRTGKITYNAKLEPIVITGTVISSATLHNAYYIIKKDIRINDFVYIKKTGNIIPEVINSVIHKRDIISKKWEENNVCPICDTNLYRLNNKIDQYCLNSLCEGKIKKSIEHFCSYNAMNIKGISKKNIEKLFNLQYLRCFSDLYKLEKYQNNINIIKNFGKKIFKNIIISINESKNNSLEKFLFGLGIKYVGKQIAELIACKFRTLNNLKNISFQELSQIKDIGSNIACSIIDFFKIKNNVQEINNLIKLGVNQNYIIK